MRIALSDVVVKEYDGDSNRWDTFVENSKNGHFMFNRGYMDYHSDRFEDNSLCFFKGKKMVAVLPANRKEKSLFSHQGLTFGGFVTDKKMKAGLMLSVFDALHSYLKENGIEEFIYKRIPSIYHVLPSDEDLYALFRNNYEMWRCDISSAITYKQRIKYSDSRKSIINRSRKAGVVVEKSSGYDRFWELLERIVSERHGVKPTHSLDEIVMLAGKFPKEISLYTAELDGELLAGGVIFTNGDVVHTQYLASSDSGRQIGALDFLLDSIILENTDKEYFDFGISNEDNGHFLNEGLCFQKEGFGGRGIVHQFYKWQSSACKLQ